MHSPGGRASDGVAISNLLRNHRAKIVVVVDGLAASAASVIAIAGDEIVMCPGSQMMLHDASIGTWGNAAQAAARRRLARRPEQQLRRRLRAQGGRHPREPGVR
ncbi:hypothetical protein G5V59_26925 [Nocardioides sp. W3-2-3]|nr:hypothetical protein [Nocardioides convexus]